MHRDLNVVVETEGWVEDSLEPREGDWSLRFAVHRETQCSLVEVEQNSHDAALCDATVSALRVLRRVHEPTALAIDVHRPAIAVFT